MAIRIAPPVGSLSLQGLEVTYAMLLMAPVDSIQIMITRGRAFLYSQSSLSLVTFEICI